MKLIAEIFHVRLPEAYPSDLQEFARGQTVKSMRASGTTGPRMDWEALFSLLETVTMGSGGMECATVMGDWIAKIISFAGDFMQGPSPDMVDSIQACMASADTMVGSARAKSGAGVTRNSNRYGIMVTSEETCHMVRIQNHS